MSFKLSHFDNFTESFDETKNRSGFPTIYVKEAIFSHSLLTTRFYKSNRHLFFTTVLLIQ